MSCQRVGPGERAEPGQSVWRRRWHGDRSGGSPPIAPWPAEGRGQPPPRGRERLGRGRPSRRRRRAPRDRRGSWPVEHRVGAGRTRPRGPGSHSWSSREREERVIDVRGSEPCRARPTSTVRCRSARRFGPDVPVREDVPGGDVECSAGMPGELVVVLAPPGVDRVDPVTLLVVAPVEPVEQAVELRHRSRSKGELSRADLTPGGRMPCRAPRSSDSVALTCSRSCGRQGSLGRVPSRSSTSSTTQSPSSMTSSNLGSAGWAGSSPSTAASSRSSRGVSGLSSGPQALTNARRPLRVRSRAAGPGDIPPAQSTASTTSEPNRALIRSCTRRGARA